MRWGLILVGLLVRPAVADEPAWPALERRFHALPAEARRLTGPLFWLHGDESPAQLRSTLAKVAEGGNGTFTAESRPHNDWLGPGWYRDLATCLEAAKAHDLTMWIFDEEWWPSGEVGGRVPREFAAKRLAGAAGSIAVGGPSKVEVDLRSAAGRLVAVLAAQEKGGKDRFDADTIRDITASVKEGRLAWDAPAGDWRVLPIVWDEAPPRRGRRLLDGASRDAVDWYIRTVYQPHHDRFGADFGRTIAGYFYDEPETPGDWGTEVIPELRRRGVDWKKAIVATTHALADPAEDAAYKYQYRYALAEAWGRTLYGGLTAWCRGRGVQSIGHFLEHNHEYLKPDLCAGDMVQLMKYSDMGAIDAVFTQFVPGKKDDSTYQTPKLGSSISHAYGKADDLAMVEIFGARGQDLSYPEMKWWTDLMHVAGINFHIPHSFNPRAPYDTDCPPYFDNGGYEPRWPLYRVYADYTSRLSLMLTGGRHVAPVAMLYLGQSAHVGRAVTPEAMTTALQDAQYDCDWIPYDVLTGAMAVDGGELVLRDERYRVLVVPPAEVVPYEAMARAKAFFDAGGTVVGYGFLPSRSATPGHAPDAMRALCEAIWGASPSASTEVVRRNDRGGRALFLPERPTAAEVARALAGAGVRPTLEVIEGDTGGWLHALHRVKDGRDVFLVANQDHEGTARRFRLRLHARGVPECWDAMRDEITSVPFTRDGEHVTLALALQPLESVLLVFAPEARALPARLDAGTGPIGESLAVVRDPNAATPPAPPPRAETPWSKWMAGLSWVWADEGDPLRAARPGTRQFRKVAEQPPLPPDATATFWIAADNGFTLYVNGREASVSGGGAGDWTRPADVNVTRLLEPGANVLAIAATNGGDGPNPAGLIGVLVITRPGAEAMRVPIDATWTVARQNATDASWTRSPVARADGNWRPAKLVAAFGDAPWAAIATPAVTLSPVKADPFAGSVEVPTTTDLARVRACLELEGLAPEEAARITVNGQDAGGFIGRPLRLDVSEWLRPGRNAVRIEPFAPRSARVVLTPR
jgi:hypothetical protein